eukprot:gene9308-16441_t
MPGGIFSSNIDFSQDEEGGSMKIEILRGKGKMQISNVQYINVSPSVVRISWEGLNYSSARLVWPGGSSVIPYGVFTFDVPGLVPSSNSDISFTPVSSTNKKGIDSSTLSVTTLPSTLTNVTLTNVTTSGARVNWTGSGYTKVVVTWTGGGSSGYIISGKSFYDADGLSSNSPYTFTVTPYNSLNIPGTATEQITTTLTGSTSMTFTSCGAKLRLGPTADQMLSAYGLSVTVGSYQGYQNYAIPQTQLYSITCYGALGGSGSYLGENGGVVSATFNLREGQIITVIVGQNGGNVGSPQEGGGGGGTWVVNSDNSTLLICAAGGNGAITALNGSSPNVLSLPPTATLVASPTTGYETGSGFDILSTNASGSKNFNTGFLGASGLNQAQGLGLGGFGGGGGGGNSGGTKNAGGGSGWISSQGGRTGYAVVNAATNYINTTYTVDVAAFINKHDELQAENVALVAHFNAVTLHVAELTSYSNAVVPLVNELQAQNAELTSYSNAVVPLVNELQAQNAELTSYSNAIAPLIDQVQARSADVTAYSNLTRHSAYSNNVVAPGLHTLRHK